MARQLRRDARGRFSSTGTVRQKRPETATSKPTKATKASTAAAGPAKAAGPPKTTTARGRALTRQREANRQLKAEQKGGGVASVKVARSAAVAARAREYYAATGTGTKRSPTKASASGATKAADLAKKPAKKASAAAAAKPARTSKAPPNAAKQRYRELTSKARQERNNPSATPRTIGAARGAVTRFENTRGVKGGKKRPVVASAAAAKPARTRKAAAPVSATPKPAAKPRQTSPAAKPAAQTNQSASSDFKGWRIPWEKAGFSKPPASARKPLAKGPADDGLVTMKLPRGSGINKPSTPASAAAPSRKPRQAKPAAAAPARSNPRAERAQRIKSNVNRSGIVPGSRFESGQAQRTLSMAEMRSAVRKNLRASGITTRSQFVSMIALEAGVTRKGKQGLAEGRMPKTRSDWEAIYRRNIGVPQSDQGRRGGPGIVRGIDIHTNWRPGYVFNLQPGAGRTEINQAYRGLAKRLHPDVGGRAKDLARIKAMRDTLLALQPKAKPAKPAKGSKRGKAAQAPPAPRGTLALPPARGGAIVPAGGAKPARKPRAVTPEVVSPRASQRPGSMTSTLRGTLRSLAQADAARIREIESITGGKVKPPSASRKPRIGGDTSGSGSVSGTLRGAMRGLAQSDARFYRDLAAEMGKPAPRNIRGKKSGGELPGAPKPPRKPRSKKR